MNRAVLVNVGLLGLLPAALAAQRPDFELRRDLMQECRFHL